jgi:hypothetical protein
MNGNNMYITHEQCEYYRREQKADWQHADDMMIDEMRGMRTDFKTLSCDFRDLSNALTKYTTIQTKKDEDKQQFESRLKWTVGILITIIGVIVTAGYIIV